MSKDQATIVIASAARTPVGSFNGALASLPAHDLGDFRIQTVRERILVERPSFGAREHQLPELFGTRQGTRVRGENAIALHASFVLQPREFQRTAACLSTPVTGRIEAWQ